MTPSPPAAPRPASQPIARLLTMLVGAPIVAGITAFGGAPFALMIGVLGAVGAAEAAHMSCPACPSRRWWAALGAGLAVLLSALGVPWLAAGLGALAAAGGGRVALAGAFGLGLPASALICLRDRPHDGLLWVLVAFFLAWGTDSWAYLGGRFFGRTPWLPRLSPSKTVEGALTGLAGGAFWTGVVLLVAGALTWRTAPLLLAGPLLALLGDALESGLKRHFRVKDSRLPGLNLLPGHGGVLDRVDSLVLISLLVTCWVKWGPGG